MVVALTPNEILEFLLNVAPVRPVFIRGAPGGAKSATVKKFCADVGLDCVVLQGSTCLPEDVIGLPFPNHTDKTTVYYPPAHLARKKPYCLFLDEFPNAKKEVQRAFYSLLQDQCTDSFHMASGSVVIAAGNRAEDNAHVNPVSSALVNRVFIIEVLDSPKEWVAWAHLENLHPLIIAYMEARAAHLRSPPTDNGEPFSSPRSWHMLSDGLKAFGEGILKNKRMLEALCYGALNAHHAQMFLAFIKLQLQKHNINRLLNGDMKWPREANDRDILYYLAHSFRDHLIKEMPTDSALVRPHHTELRHRATGLLRDLAVISEEAAQMVLTEENGVGIPNWLLTDIVRVLPRLAAKR